VLKCICFETHSVALVLAATDRYRVALDRIFWTPADPEAPSRRVNVPAVVAGAFAKKTGKSGKAAVYLTDGLAGFSDDARELTIRTTTGDFPRVGAVLRGESPVTLTADAQALAAVVERMGKVSEKTPVTGYTPVALAYAGNTVTVREDPVWLSDVTVLGYVHVVRAGCDADRDFGPGARVVQ
jgi:DNA polymerase-3 subunit beta